MNKNIKVVIIIVLIFAAITLISYLEDRYNRSAQPAQIPATSLNNGPATSTANQNPAPSAPTSSPIQIVPPIANWQSRVTKKPFGIYITPKTSPVQPEKFTGYHTGVDFETFPEEQNIDVQIYAICDGKLLQKRTASGYGGIAVQACKLNSEDITVVYGHLRLASISANIGQELKAGDKLTVLGTGFSSETDGERKHLHLGIHKGSAINILGYVQNQAELVNWLDVTNYLK
jgi:hypothetical protein